MKGKKIAALFCTVVLLGAWGVCPAQVEETFVPKDEDRVQLMVTCLEAESVLSGEWRTPETRYINVEKPLQLLGERLDNRLGAMTDENLQVWPTGLFLYGGEDDLTELAFSRDGAPLVCREGQVFAGGAGYDTLYQTASRALGYAPGKLDFLGKKLVRAELEGTLGKAEVEDSAALEGLNGLLAGLDGNMSGAGCPFASVLRLTFEDGATAEMMLAADGCDVLFYHGGCFRYAGQEVLLTLLGVEQP